MLNTETHAECLQFIRVALASGDKDYANQIAQVVSDVCKHGHADKQAILDDLSRVERKQLSLWYRRAKLTLAN